MPKSKQDRIKAIADRITSLLPSSEPDPYATTGTFESVFDRAAAVKDDLLAKGAAQGGAALARTAGLSPEAQERAAQVASFVPTAASALAPGPKMGITGKFGKSIDVSPESADKLRDTFMSLGKKLGPEDAKLAAFGDQNAIKRALDAGFDKKQLNDYQNLFKTVPGALGVESARRLRQATGIAKKLKSGID